jgi:hypothetical protein
MLLTDYQHLLFVAFLLIPYGLLTLITANNQRSRLHLIGLGIFALIIMGLLLWFVGPLPYLLTFDRSGLSPQSIRDAQGIPFPNGYFARFSIYERKITLGAIAMPAIILSLLVSITPLRKRIANPRRWFWCALIIVPLLLSLGPFITINGTEIGTPYIPFHNLFGGLFRSPSRFGAVVVIAGMIFAGQTFGPLLTRKTAARLSLITVLAFIVFAETLLYPLMPLQPPAPHYEFYSAIGKEQGKPYDDEVVLEVPVAGGSGEAWVPGGSQASGEGGFRPMEAQLYGMTHGKRMLNGSIARAPLNYFWYWLYDDPMLAWLGQRRYLEPEKVQAQLKDRINQWPIGYIVVHQDWIGHDGPTNQEIIGYFNSLPDLLCPVWVEADAIAYRTSWHPDGCPSRTPPKNESGDYQIDIGSTGDERFIGWGWHPQENISGITLRWTGEYPQTKVYVDLPPDNYELSLSTQAFWEPRQLRVLVNDQPLGNAITVSEKGLQTYTFKLPKTLVGAGKHLIITLDYDKWLVPKDIGQGGDQRKLAVNVDWIRFKSLGMG